MEPIKDSELIINPDGSIYHLNIKPEDVADTVILVGDPNRVSIVSSFFDSIELKKEKREFVTHTGHLNNKRLTVISTGIGTDNIDIVLTELDALVNIDFETRTVHQELKSLDFIRIGTSGCLQPNIPVNSIILSEFGLGLEGLLNFYSRNLSKEEQLVTEEFSKNYRSIANRLPIDVTFSKAGEDLINKFHQEHIYTGITVTCSGFYGPQGRIVRLQPTYKEFLDDLTTVKLGGHQITNFEMETSAIYGLANLLGHNALSINCIIANRANGEFSADPKAAVKQTIDWALSVLVS